MIILFGKNKLDVIFLARWSPDDIIASPFPLNRLHNGVKISMKMYIIHTKILIDFFKITHVRKKIIAFKTKRKFLTASACNAVLYISLLLLSFDFKVCENSVQNEGKLIRVDKTC